MDLYSQGKYHMKVLPSKKGFTLVELLVVISIIAMLLAILMPSLQKAREQAKKIVCQTRQRQWILATHMYGNDNEQFMPYFYDGRVNPNITNAIRETIWFSVLSPYLSQKRDSDDNYASEVRKCPSGHREKGRWQWGWTSDDPKDAEWLGWIGPQVATIEFNGKSINKLSPIFIANAAPALKVSNIQRPADWLIFIDVTDNFMYGPMGMFDFDYDQDGKRDSNRNVYSYEMYPFNRALPKVHSGGCNITLTDGHVEWIKYEKLWEVDYIGFSTTPSPIHSYWQD